MVAWHMQARNSLHSYRTIPPGRAGVCVPWRVTLQTPSRQARQRGDKSVNLRSTHLDETGSDRLAHLPADLISFTTLSFLDGCGRQLKTLGKQQRVLRTTPSALYSWWLPAGKQNVVHALNIIFLCASKMLIMLNCWLNILSITTTPIPGTTIGHY